MPQACGDRFVDAAIGAHEVATRAERQPEQIYAGRTHRGDSYHASCDPAALAGESTRIGKRGPALRGMLPLPQERRSASSAASPWMREPFSGTSVAAHGKR